MSGKLPHVWTGVRKKCSGSEDAKKKPWGVRCPEPMCFYQADATTEKDANRLFDDHPCPWNGNSNPQLHDYSKHYSWRTMSGFFVQPIWNRLDATMDELMVADSTEGRLALRGKARGIAEALAVLMPPFFDNADDISREAKRRWDARQAGDADYETPGLGRLARVPAADAETIAVNLGEKVRSAPLSADTVAAPVSHKLSDAQVASIKNAHASGMFPEELLAKTYGVSIAVIRQVTA